MTTTCKPIQQASHLFFLTVLLLAGVSSQAKAATHTWPGSAPCNSTLQACINGATNGDSIEIATDAAIDESLNLYGRSLTVRAANGFHPSLAANRWISLTTSSLIGDITASVSGIRLLDGYVLVRYNGVGTGTYELRNLDAKRMTILATNGIVEATVYNNRINGTPSGPVDGLLEFTNEGAELNAEVSFNLVTSASNERVDGAGIFIDETDGGSGELKLLGNIVRGSFSGGGIFASEGLSTSIASSFSVFAYNNVVACFPATSYGSSGINFVVNSGSMTAQAINNTVSECDNGIAAKQWIVGGDQAADATIDGVVSNNLVAGAYYGLFLVQPLAAGMDNDYNLINAANNAAGGFALGTHTITAPAELVSSAIPRLSASSPAIDAANTHLLQIGLAFNGLPVLDADGLRRLKGPGSEPSADIGAYEYGDLGFVHHVSASSNSNVSWINHPFTDGDLSLDLFATPNYNVGGDGPDVSVDIPFGSRYAIGHWGLFAEDPAVDMPDNAHFNVFLPAAGSGVFRHTVSSANTSGWATTLDDPSVNNLPDRIVLVNQNHALFAPYNNHPVGVFYFGIGESWAIINMDQQGTAGYMPVDARFSVYAQAPSPNAFRVTQPTTAPQLVLDHPLLNDTPCAQVAVTAVYGGSSPNSNFDVFYGNPGRWRIYSYGGSEIAAGAQFHVLVNPAQVELCTDVIFADGFG